MPMLIFMLFNNGNHEQMRPQIVGLGLEGQVLKYIDITNFFSYTYYTDHKNGYSRPESRNLD